MNQGIIPYPECILRWQPVFDWLTRLDARGEIHGRELVDAMEKSYPADMHRYAKDVIDWCHTRGWIVPGKYRPTLEDVVMQRLGLGTGASRYLPRYGYRDFSQAIWFIWHPSDDDAEMQEFLRRPTTEVDTPAEPW